MSDKIGYQDIRTKILERIRSKEWPLGSALPPEVALAAEFKCARATVNRALVLLAEEGIIDRKRKAGSRVSPYPRKISKFELTLMRAEVEARGQDYHCVQLSRTFGAPPDWLINEERFAPQQQALFVESLHFADGSPVQHQRTWINASHLPHAVDQNFSTVAPCEWLRADNPFCRGDYRLKAVGMSQEVARCLEQMEKSPAMQLTVFLTREKDTFATAQMTNISSYQFAGTF